jgi:hypothetical protein
MMAAQKNHPSLSPEAERTQVYRGRLLAMVMLLCSVGMQGLYGAGLQGALTMELAKQETNLEKRSDMALAVADLELDKCKVSQPSPQELFASMTRVREAVDLSVASLRESGKNPRKNPKYFKRAEVKMRELRRKLEGIKAAADIDDRPKVATLVDHLSSIEDRLVHATTSGEQP